MVEGKVTFKSNEVWKEYATNDMITSFLSGFIDVENILYTEHIADNVKYHGNSFSAWQDWFLNTGGLLLVISSDHIQDTLQSIPGNLQASTICFYKAWYFGFLVRPLQAGIPEGNPYIILVPLI